MRGSTLDYLLEKAFSDGYEYAQREFTSVRAMKKAIRGGYMGVATGNSGQIARNLRTINKGEAQAIKGGLTNKLAGKIEPHLVNLESGGKGIGKVVKKNGIGNIQSFAESNPNARRFLDKVG